MMRNRAGMAWEAPYQLDVRSAALPQAGQISEKTYILVFWDYLLVICHVICWFYVSSDNSQKNMTTFSNNPPIQTPTDPAPYSALV